MSETDGLSASERAILAGAERQKIQKLRSDLRPENGGSLPPDTQRGIYKKYGLTHLSIKDAFDLVVNYYLRRKS